MVVNDNNWESYAANQASELYSALCHISERQLGDPADPSDHREIGLLPDIPESEDDPRVQHLGKLIDVLDHTLSDAGYVMVRSEHQLVPTESSTLGSKVTTFPIRTILRGFIEPVLRAPLITRVPAQVIAFLLQIPGWNELLEREHHDHIVFHYHYLDSKKRRSDVVLCWDTRATTKNGQSHPLFWESHGSGKARFNARPDLWGHDKRLSMHDTCAPDLKRWCLSAFRCASNKAEAVWPLSAKLTPVARMVTSPP